MSFCRQMVIQKKLPFKILIANVTTNLWLCHLLNIFKINVSNYFFNDQFTNARKYILYQVHMLWTPSNYQTSVAFKISWNFLIEQLTQPFCKLLKGPFLYYVWVKGWVGGIAKYLLFLTGVGGWFWITLT